MLHVAIPTDDGLLDPNQDYIKSTGRESPNLTNLYYYTYIYFVDNTLQYISRDIGEQLFAELLPQHNIEESEIVFTPETEYGNDCSIDVSIKYQLPYIPTYEILNCMYLGTCHVILLVKKYTLTKKNDKSKIRYLYLIWLDKLDLQ